jgi:hypothetical protein
MTMEDPQHITSVQKYERILQAEQKRLVQGIYFGQNVGPLIDQLAVVNSKLAAIDSLLTGVVR